MPFKYPVMLELKGRSCVVVGGGAIAEGKVGGLLEADARVAVIAPFLTERLESLAGEEKISTVRRRYEPGDLAGAFLVIAATDDPAVNAAVYSEAQERGVLCNAVDDIDHCDFAAPSVIRRGDLTVTLSTGGKAPALAKHLRKRLGEQITGDYGTLLDLLGEVREKAIKVRDVDFPEWASRWERAMEEDLLGLVRSGRVQDARDLLWRHLSKPAEPGSKGFVWIVGAGPGDPGMMTVRGMQVLERADVVVYDRLVNPELVEGREAIYAGKTPGGHSSPQAEINELLVRLASEGKKVVRLKGGDPFVFGRGGEEAEALAEAGIEFEVVPAPSSAVAALAAAGIPVTDRRYASSVAFATGHCGGTETVDWRALAKAVDTIVILMGMQNLKTIVSELLAGGLPPQTPAAIVASGTLPAQKVVEARLENLPSAAASEGVGSPAVIVVGEVVRMRSKLTKAKRS